MDLQKFRLRGFTGIKKGLGLDEIRIDFSDLYGLIAISGDTGSGKTTIMENLQPHPVMVSRPHPALKNQVCSRKAVRELSFLMDNRMYESLIKIDAQSGRTEGYLNIDGSPTVDGKISAYKRAMIDISGSEKLFFNSSFCAQNSTKISGMRPADLKDLFAEFLGPRLDKYRANEETAKQAGAVLFQQMTELGGRISALDGAVDRIWGIEDRIVESKERISENQAERGSLEISLSEHKEALTVLKEKREASTMATARVKDLEAQKAHISEDMANLGIEKNADLSGLRGKLGDVNTSIESVYATLKNRRAIEAAADELKRIDIELERESTVMREIGIRVEKARKELGLAEHADRTEADQERKELDDIKSGIDQDERKIAQLESEIALVGRDQKALENDAVLQTIGADIARCKASASDLEMRGKDIQCDCGKTVECNSETCAFIGTALKARGELPVLKIRYDEREKKILEKQVSLDRQLRDLAKRHDETKAGHDSDRLHYEKTADEYVKAAGVRNDNIAVLENERTVAERGLAVCKDRHADLTNKIPALKELAERLPEIQIAKQRAGDLEKQKTDLIAEGTGTADAWDKRIAVKKDQADKLAGDIVIASSRIDNQIDHKILTVTFQQTETETSIAKFADAIRTSELDLATHEKELARCSAAKVERDRIQKQREALAAELSEWIYLKNACGKDGLRALEIDAVAPSITHDANLLLEAAFGPQAMVDFRTQNDDGREVLEPRCIDADGDSVLVANRSGGQQVYSLKAIRLAMTKISKEKSGRDLQTVYADEDDAGLDVKTAQKFTQLYRALQEIGHFKKCLMISHKPECVALADHVISLNGGISIR